LRDAVRLIEQAIQHAPASQTYAQRHQAYRSLLESSADLVPVQQAVSAHSVPSKEPSPVSSDKATWVKKVKDQNWEDLGDRLTRDGHVLLPGMMDADACAKLRALFAEDEHFAKTVVMDRDDFGKGVYRYFKAPIPASVDSLRRAVYPHVARVANEWQKLLNEGERFPDDWEAFRRVCAEAGQTTPTPILLRYGPGGFNALHRDLRGAIYFPIQMAVVLSPQTSSSGASDNGFTGGEFLFCDVPQTRKSRARAIAAGLGDALLFCTRDRLVRIGGAYGLQPVKHGVSPIPEGERFVLGVPFHEYR
jgi:hypothetical protein